jgi:hypothetical protein
MFTHQADSGVLGVRLREKIMVENLNKHLVLRVLLLWLGVEGVLISERELV